MRVNTEIKEIGKGMPGDVADFLSGLRGEWGELRDILYYVKSDMLTKLAVFYPVFFAK
jgi:hypothetical protein